MFHMENLKFKTILDIDALDIDQAVTCVCGPSGGGKTTLLRMLNRLSAPDSGTVTYRGRDVARMDPIALRREVVMMGQAPVLYGDDIRDNLLAGVRFSQKPDPPEAALTDAMRRVGLDKPVHSGCGTFSGGEKQRLCLARLLLMDAAVYLLDEPSSALDKKTEADIMRHLASFTRERGRMLILVTHSENAVRELSPALVRIESGKVAFLDEQ